MRGCDPKNPDREGMALLTVLLLVAVMAAVCVLILDDVRFTVRRTANVEHLAEMQSHAAIAETLAAAQIMRLSKANPLVTPVEPRWIGQAVEVQTDSGAVRTLVYDGQACFNLNSLLLGQGEDLRAQEEGVAQFAALGVALGFERSRMLSLADSLTDWMDSDQDVRGASGAEDSYYGARSKPYRTGGLMLADVSELRAIKGFDGDTYRRLRPYVCALPEARLTRLNINTLEPADAPVLVAISGDRLTMGAARAAIRNRPAQGWQSVDSFWAQPALNEVVADEQLRSQTVLVTRYFDVRIDVEAGESRASRTLVLQVMPEGQARIIIRRWTTEE